MTKIRKLLEFAMELGDTPDSIHPAHKQSLQTGSHALGKNPAFPAHPGAGMNPHERHAVGTYKSIVANLQRYGGYVPRSNQPREIMRAAQDMMQTLGDIQQREEAHQKALERLAIETVMRLPEFKRSRKNLEAGTLTINAYLNRRIDIQGMQSTDDEREQPEEFQVPEIKAEYEMVHKRKMVNTLIQGTAVSNNYSFAYYSRDELNALDPTLVKDYGKLMAYSELGYFIQDPQMVKAAARAGGSEAQGGEERLTRNEDGSITILARGITFPILVQEIIKGMMEFISWNDEEDDTTQRQVNKEADFVEDEQVQMQLGPNIYRQMVDAIGHDSLETWPYLHDALVKMPVHEFNQRMQGLISGSSEGKAWFKQLAQQLRQKLAAADERAGQQESLAKRMCS